jgi:hypothetical protein
MASFTSLSRNLMVGGSPDSFSIFGVGGIGTFLNEYEIVIM